jgi:hypothetical protein
MGTDFQQESNQGTKETQDGEDWVLASFGCLKSVSIRVILSSVVKNYPWFVLLCVSASLWFNNSPIYAPLARVEVPPSLGGDL